MKKVIMILIMLFIFSGCDNKMLNTPTKKVEMFFEKYQSLDQDVLNQLDNVTSNELSFNEKQSDKYKEIMKRHYQSLKYEIKDEVIDGDTAIVTVEIEVMDYSKILDDADNYLEENKDEFLDENGEYDETLFNDYRLKQLEDAKETVTYTIDMTLTKIDEEWMIDDVSRDNADKIQGVYKH